MSAKLRHHSFEVFNLNYASLVDPRAISDMLRRLARLLNVPFSEDVTCIEMHADKPEKRVLVWTLALSPCGSLVYNTQPHHYWCSLLVSLPCRLRREAVEEFLKEEFSAFDSVGSKYHLLQEVR